MIMRKEFLRQVAEVFLENEGDDLKDFCFVFSNRRSSIFFQKYLGLASSKPILSPNITTINSLFLELSGLSLGDKTALLYTLYKIYLKHVPQVTESFDDFLFWGDMLLNDFDDIDKYLVDAEKLFTNVSDLKELDMGYDFFSENQRIAVREFWGNFIPYKDGEKEQSFLKIWSNLFSIYSEFREFQYAEKKCYEGMIYRHVAISMDGNAEILENVIKYKKVVFVGLNAMNKCEKKLLDSLALIGKADYYWDYFGDIIKDPYNKSSFFMDVNVKKYKSHYKLLPDGGAPTEKQEIEVIGIPSMVGQTKYISKILKEIVKDTEDIDNTCFNTAVVLPDENLLHPVLNSIPLEIEKVNVTMGYTLSNSNIATFMSLVADLQKKIRLSGSKISFYYSTVLGILDHPFIRNLALVDATRIRRDIVARNMIFVSPEFLRGENVLELIFNPLSSLSLDRTERIHLLAEYQITILKDLQKSLDPIDREFAYHYYTAINRLRNLNLPIEVNTYFKLLQQTVSSISIPFKGEPLSGLQIMGTLETRALDFENLIILSVNEGVFPSRSVSSSFIPYNIRKGFDLPNYEFQDSISAYHFYRSLYRAKKIYLIYDTRTDGMSSGEVSRYVKQLKYHHNVEMRERVLTYNISSSEKKDIEVIKTPEMLSVLSKKNFSASSINTYFKCQLWFYYQMVEGIKESNAVHEDVDSGLFGTLFHEVMEDIYRPFQGKQVSKLDLEKIISDTNAISSHILSAFKSKMGVDEILGKNKIKEALIYRYVDKILKYDLSISPFSLLGTEQRFKVPISIMDGGITLSLFGIIDRMDVVEGVTRVIDYKTGSVSIDYKEISELFDESLDSMGRASTAFQLLFYLLVLSKVGKISNPSNVELDIYSLKDIFKGIIPKMGVCAQELDEFESNLISTLDSIFNLSIPFTQTSNEMACTYCPYKILCNK